MAETSEIERDLRQLGAELRRLETEYRAYFAGRQARPPLDLRSRVDALVKRLDRGHIANYATRFRFSTLQSRFMTFADLWDRALRAREEGRPGPFRERVVPDQPERSARVVSVVTFHDPDPEPDKLRALYDRIKTARRETGERPVRFDRFARLVGEQIAGLRRDGHVEVSVRVAIEDGRVNVTAKGLRGAEPDAEI